MSQDGVLRCDDREGVSQIGNVDVDVNVDIRESHPVRYSTTQIP